MITKLINPAKKLATMALVVLAVLNLIGTNLLATQGHQLKEIRQETAKLKQENVLLSNQISQQSSLANPEQWADTNSFIKITQPITLTTPAPVAYVAQ